jgi:hypothetical protein
MIGDGRMSVVGFSLSFRIDWLADSDRGGEAIHGEADNFSCAGFHADG